jgi:hypothetical protein
MKNSSIIFLSSFLLLAIISSSSAAANQQQRPQRLRSRHVLQTLGFSFSEPCYVCREGFELEAPDLVVALGDNNDDMTCGVAKNAGMLGWIPSDQCNELRRTCLCIDPTRKAWPELVGMDAEQAKQIIEDDEPDLDVFILSPDSYVGMEYKQNRVWIRTDSDGTVKNTPMIG